MGPYHHIIQVRDKHTVEKKPSKFIIQPSFSLTKSGMVTMTIFPVESFKRLASGRRISSFIPAPLTLRSQSWPGIAVRKRLPESKSNLRAAGHDSHSDATPLITAFPAMNVFGYWWHTGEVDWSLSKLHCSMKWLWHKFVALLRHDHTYACGQNVDVGKTTCSLNIGPTREENWLIWLICKI